MKNKKFLVLVAALASALILDVSRNGVLGAELLAPSSPMSKSLAVANLHRALSQVFPNTDPEYVGAAPFPGFFEVLIGGQVIYISYDGIYLMQSQPYDLQRGIPVTGQGLKDRRRELLASISERDRIAFSPPVATHVVTVFTDIDCGFCRRMHQQIKDYNRLGIAVQYVAFPRMGPASKNFAEMESVWCSNDRNGALTKAKSGQSIRRMTCVNAVASQYDVGQRMGLNGTPAIFTKDGDQLGGYVSPEDLLQALERRLPPASKSH